MPGTASIASSLAAIRASIEPNASANTWATWPPTCRMLSPTSSRQSGRSFEASICWSTLAIALSLKPGSCPSFSASSA
jgi:hypothetical protein